MFLATLDSGSTTVTGVDPTFAFDAELWLHSAGSWVMVTIPEDETDEIQEVAPHPGGFGSVRVEVQVGESTWRTSVFPSNESGCFVLPIKKQIRNAEKIDVGDMASIELTVLMD